jgi:hypothetical protein
VAHTAAQHARDVSALGPAALARALHTQGVTLEWLLSHPELDTSNDIEEALAPRSFNAKVCVSACLRVCVVSRVCACLYMCVCV